MKVVIRGLWDWGGAKNLTPLASRGPSPTCNWDRFGERGCDPGFSKREMHKNWVHEDIGQSRIYLAPSPQILVVDPGRGDGTPVTGVRFLGCKTSPRGASRWRTGLILTYAKRRACPEYVELTGRREVSSSRRGPARSSPTPQKFPAPLAGPLRYRLPARDDR